MASDRLKRVVFSQTTGCRHEVEVVRESENVLIVDGLRIELNGQPISREEAQAALGRYQLASVACGAAKDLRAGALLAIKDLPNCARVVGWID